MSNRTPRVVLHVRNQESSKRLKMLEDQDSPSQQPKPSLGERLSKLPQWYAVHEVPPAHADPDGYMNMIADDGSYTSYANVLGIQPWVVQVLKKTLHWRYINHPRTPHINLAREDDKDRLAEEINITFRNYATSLNERVRKGLISADKLEGKLHQYEAMEELSAKVYKIGSYRVSGYLLYKVAEGVMMEIIDERKAIDGGLIDRAGVVPGKPAEGTSKPQGDEGASTSGGRRVVTRARAKEGHGAGLNSKAKDGAGEEDAEMGDASN
ncbi:hypothetical protein TWF481_009143 [Arthrobotrys musiformis]|uniref:Uncharacterized protein n=1 Tax=Arthrobotrys musiformis TaxID=47236 RepID=A0AAV9W4S5_9PEZI